MLIGIARPATNGNRTSTKYQTKITEQPGKVNFSSIQKTRSAYLFFGDSPMLTHVAGLFKLKLTK